MKNEQHNLDEVTTDKTSLEQKWVQLNRELVLSKIIKEKYISQTEITYTNTRRIILQFSNSNISLRAVFDSNTFVIDLTQIQIVGVNTLKPNLPKRLVINTGLHS
jgi:hypothetical protein